MTLKQKLDNYFSLYPIDDNAENKYKNVRQKFKISLKTASKYWIDYKKGLKRIPIGINTIPSLSENNFQKSYSSEEINVSANIDYEIKSINDLIKVCEVDTKLYEVAGWETQKRDIKIDNKVKPLFTVKARFRLKKVDTDLNLQKDIILKELYTKSPKSSVVYSKKNTDSTKLLELALFDVHFGKLAHKDEVGEDYDLNIARERWNNAVDALLSRVNLATVGKILLPLGQDLINIDNFRNQTTAGTPQDTDSRFYKIIRLVRDTVVSTVDKLKYIAPVDIVVVPGNHDSQTTFMLGDIIDAYYKNDTSVTIYNSPQSRKYYEYGNTSIMFTHGDKERFNELGMIFAAEVPKLWASTTQRYIQMGHLHHNKKQVFNVQEFQGYTIQIIPSLSGVDKWHYDKGYNSLKQAKAFLYDRKEGLIGEFTYTV